MSASEQGWNSYCNGQYRNPYRQNSFDYAEWQAGYSDARRYWEDYTVEGSRRAA